MRQLPKLTKRPRQSLELSLDAAENARKKTEPLAPLTARQRLEAQRKKV
jgi:hypothetical protein